MLVEAANLLDADQRAGRAELPDPLPIGSSGQRVVDLLLERLPPTGASAPCWSPPPSPTATSCGSSTRCASSASASPSWRSPRSTASSSLDGDRLTFRHPLMRSAAYHDAPAGRPPRRPPGAGRARCPTGLAGAGLAPGPGRRRARRGRRPGARRRGRRHRTSAARRRARPGRGSWPAGCRPSRPTGCAGCGSPPSPSSTPGWRRPPGACSTGPTPSSPSTPTPTTSSSGSAASSCAAASRRPAAAPAEPRSSLRRAASEVAGAAPDVAVDLLFDALAAYIRDGAFADMASAIEEADDAARPGRRRPGPAHRHHDRRPAASPAARPAARRCSTATPR